MATHRRASQAAQPPILSGKEVEAQTRGHPTVLLFTARGCASCVGDARALTGAAGDNGLLRRYAISSLSSTVLLDSSGQTKFVNQGPQDPSTYAQQPSALR